MYSNSLLFYLRYLSIMYSNSLLFYLRYFSIMYLNYSTQFAKDKNCLHTVILTAKDGTTITVDETQRMKRSKTERVQQVGAT